MVKRRSSFTRASRRRSTWMVVAASYFCLVGLQTGLSRSGFQAGSERWVNSARSHHFSGIWRPQGPQRLLVSLERRSRRGLDVDIGAGLLAVPVYSLTGAGCPFTPAKSAFRCGAASVATAGFDNVRGGTRNFIAPPRWPRRAVSTFTRCPIFVNIGSYRPGPDLRLN